MAYRPGGGFFSQADQEVDEQLRLLAAVPPGEAEQLLELVDQDADVVVVAGGAARRAPPARRGRG